MQQPTFDPGLTQQYSGALRRSINKDGTFNVFRRGGSWRHVHPYLHLLNMSWRKFFTVFMACYLGWYRRVRSGFGQWTVQPCSGVKHDKWE